MAFRSFPKTIRAKRGPTSNMVDYRQVSKVQLDGYTFDSKAESMMYIELKIRRDLGEISDIKVHERISLIPGDRKHAVDYYVDFSYTDNKTNQREYCEVKGFETPAWRIKLRLWRTFGPGLLKVYKYSWKKFHLSETAESKGICLSER